MLFYPLPPCGVCRSSVPSVYSNSRVFFAAVLLFALPLCGVCRSSVPSVYSNYKRKKYFVKLYPLVRPLRYGPMYGPVARRSHSQSHWGTCALSRHDILNNLFNLTKPVRFNTNVITTGTADTSVIALIRHRAGPGRVRGVPPSALSVCRLCLSRLSLCP